jgi:hypothetical protein
MHPSEDNKRYLDNPANVTRLWRWFLGACVAITAIDLLGMVGFVYHRHISLFVEGLPGFYPFWGFVGIALLILVAKQLRRIVMRPEDYYEVDRDEEKGHAD